MSASHELRFDGETVIVTGAGRGLGREHALAFAARGANVVVNDLGSSDTGQGADTHVAQSVVDEIVTNGGRAVADANSVATSAGAAGIVETALEAFGRLDVVINNAGFATYADFADVTDTQWRAMMDVTVDGAYHVSKAAWPIFVQQGHGRFVNTTSNAGFGGAPMLSHYGAAKLAVAGLTKNLALEGAEHGIRANAIAPVAVTRMNAEHFFGSADPRIENWKNEIAEGRLAIGPPALVSPAVVWLAHRDTPVTGEIFSTTSGRVAKVAFVVAEGYFNPDHTAEDLRDNAAAIRDLRRFVDMNSYEDELNTIPPLFSDYR
ncbi:SDR family NAD(P)-dependent oxidoreductase [Nocardioides sp.]|uniref:SDR family NAD(P)-dependent oxidoreductase n=1 Tax=Nocardioides sp. TaxID=35761 RepID=UPI002635568E|nr:SDR family NAD(P)-dependent oxidoreductase [Nocardioides sp.]MDI6909219.1 SDR family NAD(P)-dependent oxidoreductase [Nocardioides sp.]